VKLFLLFSVWLTFASCCLSQIKVTKLNNYEANYIKRVTESRDKEIALLRQELAVWAITLVVTGKRGSTVLHTERVVCRKPGTHCSLFLVVVNSDLAHTSVGGNVCPLCSY
jgi:hypothetical protein